MSAANAFDVVIFDYDGTLGDTRLAIAHCLERALAKHGRPIAPRERSIAMVSKGLPLRDTCLLLDPQLQDDGAAVEAIIGTYRALYRDESESLIAMFPGARTALQALHGSGIACVVVSNKGFDAVMRALDRSGMAALVALVIAERPGLPTKPDPALLNDHILPKFPQTLRQRVLMVGDTETDIAFARRSGIACCWAAYGFGDRQRCLASAPDFVIETIEELPALMRSPRDRG
jgi:phosphoglycolate phosphatase